MQEQASYTVRVLPEDCTTNYMQVDGCPLYNAIKRQLPSFPLHQVSGDHVIDKQGREWHFGDDWLVSHMYDVKEGKLPHIDVTFNLQTK